MKKTIKKKSKTIVPNPAADDDTDTSSSDEEGDQTFAVATFSNKGKDKEEVVFMDTDRKLPVSTVLGHHIVRVYGQAPRLQPDPVAGFELARYLPDSRLFRGNKLLAALRDLHPSTSTTQEKFYSKTQGELKSEFKDVRPQLEQLPIDLPIAKQLYEQLEKLYIKIEEEILVTESELESQQEHTSHLDLAMEMQLAYKRHATKLLALLEQYYKSWLVCLTRMAINSLSANQSDDMEISSMTKFTWQEAWGSTYLTCTCPLNALNVEFMEIFKRYQQKLNESELKISREIATVIK